MDSHIMKSVIEMKSLVFEDHKQLRTYYDNIVAKIHDLKSYASKVENPVDAIIVPLLESKLTKTLKQSWEKELITLLPDNEFATLEGYVEWCLKELRAREVVYKSSDHYSSQALTSGTRCVGQNVNCLFCNKSHRLVNCFGFQNVSVEERWDFTKRFSLCFCVWRSFILVVHVKFTVPVILRNVPKDIIHYFMHLCLSMNLIT